ncbi:hypothetical protein FS842_001361 [Serendipita sp. 407]|nr:hypothetical protein FS842_001361 [Serendipita sp. 407]
MLDVGSMEWGRHDAIIDEIAALRLSEFCPMKADNLFAFVRKRSVLVLVLYSVYSKGESSWDFCLGLVERVITSPPSSRRGQAESYEYAYGDDDSDGQGVVGAAYPSRSGRSASGP